MLGKLAHGDVVTVTRIDRLARSTFDLFGIVRRIVDARAQFRCLAEPWADTGTSTGRLMVAVLGAGWRTWSAILSAPAPAKDAARAVANGVKLGRKPKLTPHQRQEAKQRVAAGKETLREIARSYNVHNSTISRLTP
jgi:DNA invertase Pin-like site-specific DNA recombinase